MFSSSQWKRSTPATAALCPYLAIVRNETVHLYVVCMAEHLHLDQSSSRHRWCFTCHKPWSWRWWRGWRRRWSRGPRPARVFLMGTSQWLHCWWGKHCYTSNVSFPKTCSHRLRTPTVWQINLACSSECLLSGLWSDHRIGILRIETWWHLIASIGIPESGVQTGNWGSYQCYFIIRPAQGLLWNRW